MCAISTSDPTSDLFAATSAIETETAIANKADINAVNEDGLSVVAKACFDCNLEKMTVLLKHGANLNVNDIDENGLTPLLSIFDTECRDLHHAETEKYKSILELLVTHGVDINQRYLDEDDENTAAGQTILFHCRVSALMTVMLEYGIDVNAVDVNGNTALTNLKEDSSYDADTDYPLLRELLLAAGANVNHRNRKGQTALMLACRIDPDLFEDDELYQLIGEIQVSGVRQLIEARADVNLLDNRGRSVLMYLFNQKQPLERSEIYLETLHTCMTLLIEAGADVNQCDKKGKNVVSYVCHSKFWEGFTVNYDEAEGPAPDTLERLIAAGAVVDGTEVIQLSQMTQRRDDSDDDNSDSDDGDGDGESSVDGDGESGANGESDGESGANGESDGE